jgi:solute carrier family 25 protein 39/40
VLRQYGVSGLFLGLTPTLLRDVPFSGVYWFLYESVRVRSLAWLQRQARMRTGSAELLASFAAGATAGTVAAVVTNPADVVKTMMQVQRTMGSPGVRVLSLSLFHRADVCLTCVCCVCAQAAALGVVGTARALWRDQGWAWLGRGMVPRTARIAPACGIMISTYEVVKMLLQHSMTPP